MELKSKNLHANALQTDWAVLIKPRIIETYFYDMGKKEVAGKVEEVRDDYAYILGNPPFIGHHLQSERQKEDLHHVLRDIQAAGVMDYVTAWYYKASEYVQKTKIKVGFVSTNSIAQGEQVGILWSHLIGKFNMKIHFAHRTFKWSNEAKGNAAVYCVIIGFANFDTNEKIIFDYEDIKYIFVNNDSQRKNMIKRIKKLDCTQEEKDLLITKICIWKEMEGDF